MPSCRVIAVVVACVSLARVGQAMEPLEAARQAKDNAEWERAVDILQKLLEQEVPADDELAAWSMLAELYFALGRRAEGRRAFVEVLRRDPNFDLPPQASPMLRRALEAARADMPPPSGTQPTVGTTIPDKPAVGATTPDKPAVGATTPDKPAVGATTPDKPTVGAIVPPPAWYETWWVWTAVGVVLTAAAAGATWAYYHPSPPSSDFGPDAMH